VGWIRIPDTEIDFAVVYSGDNSYYLNHSFEKEYSQLGTPFLDYRCSSDFSDYNSIIYGHHIKGGRMFAALDSFKSEDYFINHSTGSLITNDRIYTVHFVACLVCESDGAAYTVVFLNEDEKTAYLEKLRSKALVLKDFETDELLEKRLITLSTCSYEYEDARTVLIGWLE
jgi:sortase B